MSRTPVCQGCISRSRFGMQGSKPVHCKDHRQPGLFPWLTHFTSVAYPTHTPSEHVIKQIRHSWALFPFKRFPYIPIFLSDGARESDVHPCRPPPRSKATYLQRSAFLPHLSMAHLCRPFHATFRRNQPLPPAMRLSRLCRHPDLRRGREETGEVRRLHATREGRRRSTPAIATVAYIQLCAIRAPTKVPDRSFSVHMYHKRPFAAVRSLPPSFTSRVA